MGAWLYSVKMNGEVRVRQRGLYSVREKWAGKSKEKRVGMVLFSIL